MKTEMESQQIEKIKDKLPHGSYPILSAKLDGKYKPGTIKAMFNGHRTMKKEVLEAAEQFIETIQPEPVNQ